MDNISFKYNNIYTIPNNNNNKYIITFLSNYNLIKSIDNNFITLNVDSIKPLEDNSYIEKKSDKYINKFIYDIGSQILLLKHYNLAIKYFNLSDIVVINSDIFLFINNNMLFTLLETIDIDVPAYTYGEINFDKIDVNSLFIPYELTQNKKQYFYYTTSYYSFAKLLLYYFNIELKDIVDTNLYFFCKRCLLENPIDRTFLFI